jgi:hypothetical protein
LGECSQTTLSSSGSGGGLVGSLSSFFSRTEEVERGRWLEFPTDSFGVEEEDVMAEIEFESTSRRAENIIIFTCKKVKKNIK